MGSVMILDMPWNLLGTAEYFYMHLNRENSLNRVDDNHVLKGNISYFINDYLAISLLGEYYHHQYNGIIPFLYNEYTEGGFDKKYGEMSIGLTYMLPGED